MSDAAVETTTALAAQPPVVRPSEIILLSVTDATIEPKLAYLALTAKDGLEAVRKARMDIVHMREDCKRDAKALAEEPKRRIENINAERDRILGLLEPLESHLEPLQKRIEADLEREKREREQALYAERSAKLKEVDALELVPEVIVIHWTEEQFQKQLAIFTERRRLAIEAEEKTKALVASRQATLAALNATLPEATLRALNDAQFEGEVARIVNEREEAERQRLEAERLANERADLERQKAEQEAAAQAERERIERERQAQEQSAKAERERLDAIAQQQRQQQERIDAENARLAKQREDLLCQSRLDQVRQALGNDVPETSLRTWTDDEFKSQVAALATAFGGFGLFGFAPGLLLAPRLFGRFKGRAFQAKAAHERSEALRPDREKLAAMAEAVLLIETPNVSADAAEALSDINCLLAETADRIREIAATVT